jgi:hypothetical protein
VPLNQRVRELPLAAAQPDAVLLEHLAACPCSSKLLPLRGKGSDSFAELLDVIV